MRILFNTFVMVLVMLLAAPAFATNHTVLMLNSDSSDAQHINVFEPAILHVDVGDTVTFIPADNGYNSASKRGMLPEGADSWNSPLDEEFTITYTVPGVYGYICVPHYEMGMVGLIVVGDDTSNLAQLKKVRQAGNARKAFKLLLDTLE